MAAASPHNQSPTDATSVGVASHSGTLVPLYIYPANNAWQPLIAQKAAHPGVDVIAVVNPGDGPGRTLCRRSI